MAQKVKSKGYEADTMCKRVDRGGVGNPERAEGKREKTEE